MRTLLVILAVIALGGSCGAASMQIEPGAVNGVLVESAGHRLAVYGWDDDTKENRIDTVLVTHGRRDVAWKAEALADAGAAVVAPNRERYALEKIPRFLEIVPDAALPRLRSAVDQDPRGSTPCFPVGKRWRNHPVARIEHPGARYSGLYAGAVSYLTHIGEQHVAFTGDLICGDGQILDLYSFQDAIPAAQVRGYHGYGSRLAELVTSLEKLAAADPDVLVPARGPVIRDPQTAITRLIDRVRRLYRNYLSTNALHWYFKKDRMRQCGERVLGVGADVELMPYSHHEKTPSWVFEQGTSRLLISSERTGFLLDCGSQRALDAITDLLERQIITQVEGIFVTHYHDDHTQLVEQAATQFHCPVYATAEYADVLRHPESYHLPAMTDNAISKITVVKEGQVMRWHDFQLTFYFFPGQTYFHGGLLASKEGERPIFFVGDAFAPSGIDDYCVRNRNLLGDDQGYLYCLKKLRSTKPPFWLVNQHIPFVFEFSDSELHYLESRYRERIAIQEELFPWDAPNYGVDDRWAVFYPHGATWSANKASRMTLQITNHSPKERVFHTTLHVPRGWTVDKRTVQTKIAAGATAADTYDVSPHGAAANYLITADVESDGMSFRRWAEALITLE